MIFEIADAKADKAFWLEQRKGYLTSSDFYTWLGDTPSWWSDTKHSILLGKQEGSLKEFPPEVQVSVNHGSFDEEHIMAKFAREVGADVEPVNSLTTNERWPGLAASIDGYVHSIEPGNGEYGFGQDEDGMLKVARYLEDYFESNPSEKAVCEIKKSTSAGWSQGKVSEWYMPQVQGQLHILELDVAVLVCDTIMRQKNRLFWNLTAHIVERDPEFSKVMDRLNGEFLSAMEEA